MMFAHIMELYIKVRICTNIKIVIFLSKYIIENKEEYYYRLEGVSQRGDRRSWLLFMLLAIKATADITYDKINQILDLTDSVFMPQKTKFSQIIKTEALQLGFDACGIAKAAFLDEDASRLRNWLNSHMFGEMKYMTRHFSKRIDPQTLVPGAKSVISVILNYFPAEEQKNPNAPVISKYAYGEDYHLVVKRKLNKLFDFIREEIGEVNGRAFVDSAPVLERVWAARAGLGWIGKNSMLISKKHGSFVFLGELMVDLELEYDEPSKKDYCGTCTECIDACPTGAIVQPCVVDASKCISYLTVELKEEIPGQFKGQFQNRAFGCDICQDVCPWNRKVKPHQIEEFEPEKKFLEMTRDDWYQLGEEDFRKLFKNSALKRSGYKGLMRNIRFID